jgi:hypothetical protein
MGLPSVPAVLESEDDAVLKHLANRATPLPIPRKVSRKEVERTFHRAFEMIGGIQRFVLWADSNPTDFYKLWARTLPNSAPEGNGQINVNITWASNERLSYQARAVGGEVEDAVVRSS